MDLTAMLAAILTAILDPENFFRFVELLLKKQSCFDKILIDLFTKLWLFVTVGVKWVINILLMSSPVGTIYRECTLFYYMLEF